MILENTMILKTILQERYLLAIREMELKPQCRQFPMKKDGCIWEKKNNLMEWGD